MDMESNFLLVLKYELVMAVMRITCHSGFHDVLSFVCGKWKNLNGGSVNLTYSMPGFCNCLLDNDEDFQNMLLLASSVGVDKVSISVKDCSSVVESGEMIIDKSMALECASSSGISKEVDVLSSYCSIESKKLLSADWVHGISHVGQFYVDGAEGFRDALVKYSIQVGFEFEYKKNEKYRITAVCHLMKSTGCKWQVHATSEKCNGYFYIRSLDNIHTCGAAYRSSKSKKMSSKLVASIIKEEVRNKPLYRPIDVVNDLNSKYGVSINYNNAWLGVEKARAGVYGHHTLSFNEMRWYIDGVKSSNPGSYVVLESDEKTGKFKRFFIAFHACIEGFKYCRPLLFLDGTFLKGRYKGNLLAATGKDGNQG